LYEAPSYESSMLASYLPVPLSGMFGAAQISTANGKGGLYELTSAVAVLRPLQGQSEPQQQVQNMDQLT
jgi:small ligand-binding sensory domain FIST